MNGRVVTLGEIMLRLSPPGRERLLQRPRFEASFGGAEANVAVSLARLGIQAAYVTVLPDNPLADACIEQLRAQGVDVSLILRGEGRMGVYFIEAGVDQRPSRILYDRDFSAMSLAGPERLEWGRIFQAGSWFHITGVTPALSQRAADLALAAARAAKEAGLTVSCDYNFRSKLWNYGKAAPEVMGPLMEYVDMGIGGEYGCRLSFGIEAQAVRPEGAGGYDRYQTLCERMLTRFPGLRCQALTVREGESASQTIFSACLHNGDDFLVSSRYQISPIVDRVGSGDAFSAGLIYARMHGMPDQETLEFATAAGCLKHSIPGDWNLVSAPDVCALMSAQGAGWIER
jgi:2-dehydro-3-deoxygluconokinase